MGGRFRLTSPRSHLSVGRCGVSDFLSHRGEDGNDPALTIKLVPKTSPDAAEQSGQEVLIAGAELTVLKVVLQQPEEQKPGLNLD